MIVENRTAAVLITNSCTVFPRFRWLSQIVCIEVHDFGWDGVDFETLAAAQIDIENWWRHACLGKPYRP